MSTAILDNGCRIPAGIDTLDDFLEWAFSDEFPRTGRVDFIDGYIEVDMAADRVHTHGIVVGEIAGEVHRIVKAGNFGQIFGSQTRIASAPANLSSEPDVKVVLWDSLRTGRVRYSPPPRSSIDEDSLIYGGPDLVVEVVSPNSVTKDTKRLPLAYFAAGVQELWLVDARGDHIIFSILERGALRFEPVASDAEGFTKSKILGGSFRLGRSQGPVADTWIYRLEHRA